MNKKKAKGEFHLLIRSLRVWGGLRLAEFHPLIRKHLHLLFANTQYKFMLKREMLKIK
jgi:hypothetical protein